MALDGIRRSDLGIFHLRGDHILPPRTLWTRPPQAPRRVSAQIDWQLSILAPA